MRKLYIIFVLFQLKTFLNGLQPTNLVFLFYAAALKNNGKSFLRETTTTATTTTATTTTIIKEKETNFMNLMKMPIFVGDKF